MQASAAGKPDRTPRRLYGAMALVAILVAFLGFAPSYYLKAFTGAPALSALVHTHGLVMSLWVLLFLAQVRLVAAGRTDLHRRLGIGAAFVAAMVVVVGAATAIEGARRGLSPGPPPLVFLAFPLGVVAVFAVLVAAALLVRGRRDWHKRLMLLATLGLLTPAIARFPVLHEGGPPLFFGLTDLLVLGVIAYDTARNRRLHRAYLYGTLFFLASQPLRVAIAHTPAWLDFAAWLTS